MSQWIKCSERLPEDGTWVLMHFGTDAPTGLCMGLSRFHAGMYMHDPGGMSWLFDSIVLLRNPGIKPAPTHWMPLPDPPED